MYTAINKACVTQAKLVELDSWKQFDVYEVVPNQGQDTISTRWVITQKESGTKARLVVRGFEECPDVQTDSPTVAKDSLRVFIALASSMNWDLRSVDIKAAFLQGNVFDRDVYVKPPREAQCSDQVLWKLSKAVYGLVDASRHWFMSIKDRLISFGCAQSKLDKAYFTWYEGATLSGMIIIHVDDFIYAGSERFISRVVSGIRNSYVISNECSECFHYVGLSLSHNAEGILLSQEHYSETIKPIPVANPRRAQKHAVLSAKEKKFNEKSDRADKLGGKPHSSRSQFRRVEVQ